MRKVFFLWWEKVGGFCCGYNGGCGCMLLVWSLIEFVEIQNSFVLSDLKEGLIKNSHRCVTFLFFVLRKMFYSNLFSLFLHSLLLAQTTATIFVLRINKLTKWREISEIIISELTTSFRTIFSRFSYCWMTISFYKEVCLKDHNQNNQTTKQENNQPTNKWRFEKFISDFVFIFTINCSNIIWTGR